MKEVPTIDAGPSGLQSKEQFVALARELIGGRQTGILTTIDEQGRPGARWMSTLSFDEFPIFYALTGPESRKVAQIQRHPAVNWMFFNENLSVVFNLIGQARISHGYPDAEAHLETSGGQVARLLSQPIRQGAGLCRD
jgi:general stress protein 26